MTDKPDEREEECTPTKRHSWHRLGGIDDCPVCNPDDTAEQAPKEWWIEFFNEPLDDKKECYKRYVSAEPIKNTLGFDIVHVIEKSFYDALDAENSRLAQRLRAVAIERDAALTMRDEYLSRLQEKCDDVLALIEERTALRAENERLKQNIPTAIIERENAIDELNKIKLENSRYREALEYCSNPDQWEYADDGTKEYDHKIARKALEQGE